jgi:hypothetical protein
MPYPDDQFPNSHPFRSASQQRTKKAITAVLCLSIFALSLSLLSYFLRG